MTITLNRPKTAAMKAPSTEKVRGNTMNTSNTALRWLRTHSAASEGLTQHVYLLARLTKDLPRVSVQQLAMFLWLANADLRGEAQSFSDLKEEFADFGRSVHTTYKIWLEPSAQFPSGLSWLEARPHPTDGRKSTIHLTERGATALYAALKDRSIS